MRSVKVFFNNEVFRVGAPYFEPLQWSIFTQRLAELTRQSRAVQWKVTYVDDEGDTVHLSSDPELAEAFRVQGDLAKFTVECVKKSNTAPVLEQPTAPPAPEVPSPLTMEDRPDWSGTNTKLLQALKKNEWERARHLALEGVTSDNVVLLYNSACAFSRLHELDLCFQALERSVECGYRNVTHLQEDSDFAAARKDEKFAFILQLIRTLNESADK